MRQFLPLLVALSLFAAPSLADLITLKNGKTYKGKLITQSSSVVKFEVDYGNNFKLERVFIKSTVVKLVIGKDALPEPAPKTTNPTTTKPAPRPAPTKSGDKYFLIPIRKQFGVEVRASVVEKCLQTAKKNGADVIVLEVNSGGGLVSEMTAMMDLLMRWQQTEKTPLVVLVNTQAFSAAAITTLSVKNIYMMPGSAMGAALIIQVNSVGQVRSVDSTKVGEKFSSAIRAKARTIAETAGNNPLITDAMIDPDVIISVATDTSGKKVLLRGAPSANKGGSYSVAPKEMLAKGKLLTLTAREATDLGVVDGIAANLDELGKAMGKPNWSLDDAGVKMVELHERGIEKNIKDYEKLIERIKLASSKIRTTSGYDLTKLETLFNAARLAIAKIQRMAKEHPYIAQRTYASVPEGMDKELIQIERILGQIKDIKRRNRLRRR